MFIKGNLLLLLLLISFRLFSILPEVKIDNINITFKQLTSDIDENNRRVHLKKPLLPIQFYKYTIQENDTIFSVSARLGLNYDTIATINNLQNQLFFIDRKSILIPTCNGLYLNNPDLENHIELQIEGEKKYFYPGRTFSSKNRLMFLITPFSSPLKVMIITSVFGYRSNPFTKVKEFHAGLDLKANVGTDLLAPYQGVIESVGYSDLSGNFLIIRHLNNYSSLYYHLKRVVVKKGDRVLKGDLIGFTGNSGRSTGPHLHLEIHYKDEPINPSRLLGEV